MDLPRRHPSGSHWTWSQLFPSFLVFLQLCTITSFVNAAPQNITLDDTSPRITYAPADAWLPGQNCGTPGFDCRVNRLENFGSNGTWHYGYYNSANNTGSLSAELTFNGTAVSVFGVIARGATYIQQVLNFVVDGNTMGVYRMEGLENPGDAGYGLPFFHSPNLTDGEHKLRVETQGGATESLIMLDRFVYTPSEALVTSASPSPSSTSSAPTSSASAAATDSRGTISRPVVGGIAAAVAVLVLLLVALAFFLYRRRSRRPGAHREAVLEDDERTYPGGPTLVQPYSVPSTIGSSTHLTTSGPAMTEKRRADSASRPERRPSMMKGSVVSPSSETSGTGSSSTSPGTSTTQNLDSVPVEAMMMNLAARGVPVPGDATPPAYATL